jgi:hypothetical protein
MGMRESKSKRRAAVAINYCFLLVTLILGLVGYLHGWAAGVRVSFWLSVLIVLVTFFPVHVGTGLWRLAHTRVDRLDEREVQQTLEVLRYAYAVFTVVSLLVVLASVVFGGGNQILSLVVFWILLYLAHTLPSSVLAWRLTRVPAQRQD